MVVVRVSCKALVWADVGGYEFQKVEVGAKGTVSCFIPAGDAGESTCRFVDKDVPGPQVGMNGLDWEGQDVG